MERRWIAAVGVLALGVAGCGKTDTDGEHRFGGSYPIRAVCTTGMVADLVRSVGGDKVEVTQLMGEGVDPHRYKPSPGDVARLNAADAIAVALCHGHGMTSLIHNAGLGTLKRRRGRLR